MDRHTHPLTPCMHAHLTHIHKQYTDGKSLRWTRELNSKPHVAKAVTTTAMNRATLLRWWWTGNHAKCSYIEIR